VRDPASSPSECRGADGAPAALRALFFFCQHPRVTVGIRPDARGHDAVTGGGNARRPVRQGKPRGSIWERVDRGWWTSEGDPRAASMSQLELPDAAGAALTEAIAEEPVHGPRRRDCCWAPSARLVPHSHTEPRPHGPHPLRLPRLRTGRRNNPAPLGGTVVRSRSDPHPRRPAQVSRWPCGWAGSGLPLRPPGDGSGDRLGQT